MVDVARSAGTAAYLIPEAADLRPEWLTGVESVGVSSGASVPEVLVSQLLERLAGHGFDQIEIDATSEENVVFSMPAQLAGSSAGGRPDRESA
jgi:4-hydroxy-3-methylbut-2-enyl diphosphate reductase